jgi:RNA polymerase sigma factor (sigma-70 family)
MTASSAPEIRVDRTRPLPVHPLLGIPQVMDDASTHSSILRTRTGACSTSKWIYYQQPVRNYLKGLGCTDQDLDDLTHDTLIKLQTHIILNYEPSRPFRPYFKAAIRNFYFDRLRVKASLRQPPTERPGAAAAEDPDILAAGLMEYARQVYEHFAIDARPEVVDGVHMLHGWLIDDLTQEELAKRCGLSDRQVRTQIGRAADALTTWMQAKVNEEDLATLADLARRQGISLDLEVAGIRGLFSHLSKRKRIRVLLVLALIYRDSLQPGAVPAGG